MLTRDGFSDVTLEVPHLAELARGVHADTDVAPYVTLLDRAVADLQLTPEEHSELAALAGELGLDSRRRERAHREFLNGLIDAALEDSTITDSELDQLCRVAALLNLDVKLVTRRTDPYRVAHDTLVLAPGLKVCFTGAALDEAGNPIDRKAVLEVQAREHGLDPAGSLTKSCGLLITADTASQSSEIEAARRYGIPVAEFGDYRRALASGQPVSVTRIAHPGIAQVCGQCGESWMTARRSSNPVCSLCRGWSSKGGGAPAPGRSLRPATTVAASPPQIETLVCTACLETWERSRSRGRRPQRCPDCVGAPEGVSA